MRIVFVPLLIISCLIMIPAIACDNLPKELRNNIKAIKKIPVVQRIQKEFSEFTKINNNNCDTDKKNIKKPKTFEKFIEKNVKKTKNFWGNFWGKLKQTNIFRKPTPTFYETSHKQVSNLYKRIFTDEFFKGIRSMTCGFIFGTATDLLARHINVDKNATSYYPFHLLLGAVFASSQQSVKLDQSKPEKTLTLKNTCLGAIGYAIGAACGRILVKKYKFL